MELAEASLRAKLPRRGMRRVGAVTVLPWTWCRVAAICWSAPAAAGVDAP